MWRRILIILLVLIILVSIACFVLANLAFLKPAKTDFYVPQKSGDQIQQNKMIEKIDKGETNAELKAYFALCDLPEGCKWENKGKDYLIISVTNDLFPWPRNYKYHFTINGVGYPDGTKIPTCIYVPGNEVLSGKTVLVYCSPFESVQYNEFDKFDKVCVDLEFPKLWREQPKETVKTTVCQELTR